MFKYTLISLTVALTLAPAAAQAQEPTPQGQAQDNQSQSQSQGQEPAPAADMSELEKPPLDCSSFSYETCVEAATGQEDQRQCAKANATCEEQARMNEGPHLPTNQELANYSVEQLEQLRALYCPPDEPKSEAKPKTPKKRAKKDPPKTPPASTTTTVVISQEADLQPLIDLLKSGLWTPEERTWLKALIEQASRGPVTLTVAEHEWFIKNHQELLDRIAEVKQGVDDANQKLDDIGEKVDDLEEDAKTANRDLVVEPFVVLNISNDPRTAPRPGASGVKGSYRLFFRKYARAYAKVGGWAGLRWGDYRDITSKPGFGGGVLAGFGILITDPENENVMVAGEAEVMTVNLGVLGNAGLRGEFGGERFAFTVRTAFGGGVMPRKLTLRRSGDDTRSALPPAAIWLLELGFRLRF